MAGALFAGIGLNRGLSRIDKQRSLLQQGLRDALGKAPSPFEQDLFEGEQPIEGLSNAGTGLLADPNNQTNQLQFGADIFSAGGEAFGQSLIQQSLGFGQQDKQQSQGFGFQAQENSLNRIQKQEIADAKAQALVTKDASTNSQFGGFATKAAQTMATVTQNKEFAKQAAVPQVAIARFNDATDIVTAAGGFDQMSGADDIGLIKNFAKFLLPNEAVMTDDQIQAVKSSSIWQQMLTWNEQLAGEGGALSAQTRENLYSTMAGLADSRVAELERMTANAQQLAVGTGIDPSLVLGQTIQRRDIFGAQQAAPDAAAAPPPTAEAEAVAVQVAPPQPIQTDTGKPVQVIPDSERALGTTWIDPDGTIKGRASDTGNIVILQPAIATTPKSGQHNKRLLTKRLNAFKRRNREPAKFKSGSGRNKKASP